MKKEDFSPEAWEALNVVVDVALTTTEPDLLNQLIETLPVLEKELDVSLVFEDKRSVLDKLRQRLEQEASEQRIKFSSGLTGSVFSRINYVVSMMVQLHDSYNVDLKFTKINNNWLNSDYDFEINGKVSDVQKFVKKLSEVNEVFKPILLGVEAEVAKNQ